MTRPSPHMLRLGGALGALGIGRAVRPAARRRRARPPGQSAGDYKALVCIFLFGGNDATTWCWPPTPTAWGRYFAARNTGTDPIALLPVGTPPTRSAR